jgi:hypothetical protein
MGAFPMLDKEKPYPIAYNGNVDPYQMMKRKALR